MTGTVGFLETTGLTPAMVAIDTMTKTATVRIVEVELNDLSGVCVKLTGATADVQSAIDAGRNIAGQMGGQPIATILTRVSEHAVSAILSPADFSPLIQRVVVFQGATTPEPIPQSGSAYSSILMNQENPMALGFIETQGFTAVF